MTKEEFKNKYYNFALSASQGSGLNPILILAQAYLESGAGKSSLATKYNNFFGVKATKSWTGKTVNLRTREMDKQGKEFFITAPFRVYNSPYDSFIEQIKFLKNNSRYKNAGLFSFPDNIDKQAETLQKAGYATDINYASMLKNLSNTFAKIPINPLTTILPMALLFLITKKFF